MCMCPRTHIHTHIHTQTLLTLWGESHLTVLLTIKWTMTVPWPRVWGGAPVLGVLHLVSSLPDYLPVLSWARSTVSRHVPTAKYCSSWALFCFLLQSHFHLPACLSSQQLWGTKIALQTNWNPKIIECGNAGSNIQRVPKKKGKKLY